MRRIPELDGLRAVAVVAVVLFHCAPHGALKGGFLGVDLFFVLSGYLITSILADEVRASGRINLPNFYWRRFTRLMPALLLMLTAYVALAPIAWPNHDHFRDAILAATYVTDYSYPLLGEPKYLQHAWSLAIEEQFYLLWPLLLPMLLRSRRPLLWLASLWLAGMVWRDAQFLILGWPVYYRFDTHCTGMILGSALALAPTIRTNLLLTLGAAIVLAALLTLADFRQSAAFIPFAEAGSAILIAAAASSSSRMMSAALKWPPMQAIGLWSYAIYLWHFPIAYWAREHFDFIPCALLTLSSATAAAAISYYTVEAWGLRLRRRSNDRVETPAVAPVVVKASQIR